MPLLAAPSDVDAALSTECLVCRTASVGATARQANLTLWCQSSPAGTFWSNRATGLDVL